MNFVAALSSELKLEEEVASGLAGSVLLLVEDVVREKADFATASAIRVAVPEMRDWQMSSPTLAPGLLSVDTIPPPPNATGVRGELIAVLGRFSIDGQKADRIAALTGQFLASRMPPGNYAVVISAMPILVGK